MDDPLPLPSPSFTPPPGGVAVSGGVETTEPQQEATPTPAAVVREAPVGRVGQRRALGTLALLFYALVLTVAAFFGSAWFNVLGTKGLEAHTHVLREEEQNLEYIVALIGSAQKEVLMAAQFVNNRLVLQALLAQQQQGRTVVLLLSSTEATSTKTADFLINNGFPRKRIYFDSLPLTSQLIIVDRLHVLTGNLPFNTGLGATAGDLLHITNPKIAADYRLYMEERIRSNISR